MKKRILDNYKKTELEDTDGMTLKQKMRNLQHKKSVSRCRSNNIAKAMSYSGNRQYDIMSEKMSLDKRVSNKDILIPSIDGKYYSIEKN